MLVSCMTVLMRTTPAIPSLDRKCRILIGGGLCYALRPELLRLPRPQGMNVRPSRLPTPLIRRWSIGQILRQTIANGEPGSICLLLLSVAGGG